MTTLNMNDSTPATQITMIFNEGSQNIQHLESQVNNYNYYGTKPVVDATQPGFQDADEAALADEALVDELMPFFYNQRDVVEAFLLKVKGAKPVDVAAEVKRLVGNRVVSEMSCHKPLWAVLHENGLYDKTLSNWNQMLKA